MDQYLSPPNGLYSRVTTSLAEHSKAQTVLLIRTGDHSHPSALRTNGSCLPLARTDVPAASDDVVRGSLANAIKFVGDLEKKEGDTFPLSARLERERKGRECADRRLKEASEKGIDNVYTTWRAVRRVKTVRMGESFDEWEPYPFRRPGYGPGYEVFPGIS